MPSKFDKEGMKTKLEKKKNTAMIAAKSRIDQKAQDLNSKNQKQVKEVREAAERKVNSLKKQMVTMETEMKKRTEAAMQTLKDKKQKDELRRKEKEK